MIVKDTIKLVPQDGVILQLESGLDVFVTYGNEFHKANNPSSNYIFIHDSRGNGLVDFEPENFSELLRTLILFVDGSSTEIGDLRNVSWFNNAYNLLSEDECQYYKENYVNWYEVGGFESYNKDCNVLLEEALNVYFEYSGGFALIRDGDIIELWLYPDIIPVLSKICERVI